MHVILTDTHNVVWGGAWKSASSGTLATRRYMLQNWRADVVATTRDNGDPYEYIRYSPYGVPTTYPAMDANRDMVTNSTDETDWLTVFSGGSANIVIGIDTNKDSLYPDTGDFDYMADEAADTAKRGGYGKVGTATGSVAPLRFAYAGYAWDPAIKMCHVRHRVYNPDMGRWLRRDPLAIVAQQLTPLYEYVLGGPLKLRDPSGLFPFGGTVCNFGPDPILICGDPEFPWQTPGAQYQILQPTECSTIPDADFYYIPGIGWYKCKHNGTCNVSPTNPSGRYCYWSPALPVPVHNCTSPGRPWQPSDGIILSRLPPANQYCKSFCRLTTPSLNCTAWNACMSECLQTTNPGTIPPCPFLQLPSIPVKPGDIVVAM